MIKTTIYALFIFFIIMFYDFRAIAASDEPIYTEDELAKMAASASSVKPEDVKNAMTIIQEATVFFNSMAYENALPSTSNKVIKRTEATLDPPDFTIKYPIKVIIDVELKNETLGHQQYTMEKAGMSQPWKLLSAYQMNADKKKVADLKLPSQEEQNKANDKVPVLLKEWNDQK